MTEVTGIILAGGKSSRMGSNKAFLELNGISFLQLAINVLTPVCDEILIIGETGLSESPDYRVYSDAIKEIGPLGGLNTGLTNSNSRLNMVIPCDMPFLTEQLLNYMLDNFQSEKDAFIPVLNKRRQLLCAIYDKKVNRQLIKMIDEGTRKVGEFVDHLEIQTWDVPENYELQFKNVNNRTDFQQLNS